MKSYLNIKKETNADINFEEIYACNLKKIRWYQLKVQHNLNFTSNRIDDDINSVKKAVSVLEIIFINKISISLHLSSFNNEFFNAYINKIANNNCHKFKKICIHIKCDDNLLKLKMNCLKTLFKLQSNGVCFTIDSGVNGYYFWKLLNSGIITYISCDINENQNSLLHSNVTKKIIEISSSKGIKTIGCSIDNLNKLSIASGFNFDYLQGKYLQGNY